MTQNASPSSKRTLGEILCDQNGIKFPDVFSQQFRIVRASYPRLPGFADYPLGEWRLEVATTLPCAYVQLPNSDVKVATVGIAVDSKNMLVNEARISELKGFEEAIAYLTKCAGRYAFIVTKGLTVRLYLDPLGTLGAVYDIKTGCVASTINLALTRDPIPNDIYPLAVAASVAKARFAFGHTTDKFVKRLLPNHYLDLNTLQQTRFWPTQDMQVTSTPADESKLLSTTTDRLTSVIACLAEEFEGVKLPISGGLDSRVMLACAKPSLDRLFLFSHATNMMSRRDTRIARNLAEQVGKLLTVYDPALDVACQFSDDDVERRLRLKYQIATGDGGAPIQVQRRHLEVHNATPRGGVVLRGNGVDFLKAVLWRTGINEYRSDKPHSVQTGLRMMMLASKSTLASLDKQALRFLRRSYKAWYASLPDSASSRPFDFMFAEQFLSHGAGNMFYGFDRNFYLCPFSDRSMLAAAIALRPDHRAAFHYTERIIHDLASELQYVTYAKKGVNAHLAEKRLHDPGWFKLGGDHHAE